jgi:hypothetical protein
MRTLMIAISGLALMASVASSGTDGPLDPGTNRTWSLAQVTPGQRLDIRLETGAGLRIMAWDKNEISVVSDLGEDRCPDARIALTRTPDGAKLESVYPGHEEDAIHNCSLEIDVRVPRHFDVLLWSAGGSVQVSNLRGTVAGTTGGGKIVIDQMKGEVRLGTGGGAIHVRNSDLDGHLSAGGGGISFDNVAGPVTASSGSKSGVVRGKTRTT